MNDFDKANETATIVSEPAIEVIASPVIEAIEEPAIEVRTPKDRSHQRDLLIAANLRDDTHSVLDEIEAHAEEVIRAIEEKIDGWEQHWHEQLKRIVSRFRSRI